MAEFTTFRSIFQTINPFRDKGTIRNLLKSNEVDRGEIQIPRDEIPTSIKGDQKLTTQYAMYIAALKIDDYREAYYEAYSQIRNNYLLQAVLEIMVDDALRADKTTGNIITLKSHDKEMQKHLYRLQSRIDLDTIITDVTPDMCLFGEYALKIIKEPGKGIVHLDDIYDIKDLLPIYRGGKITSYMLKKHEWNMAQGNALLQSKDVINELPFKKVNIKDYAYFVKSGRRLKVKLLPSDFSTAQQSWLQDIDLTKMFSGVARIGRSIVPISLVNLIKSLETLESIIPLMRLLQLDRRSLIGVRFPGVTRIDKVQTLVQEYERIINDTYAKASAVNKGDVDVEDFLSSTTK